MQGHSSAVNLPVLDCQGLSSVNYFTNVLGQRWQTCFLVTRPSSSRPCTTFVNFVLSKGWNLRRPQGVRRSDPAYRDSNFANIA